MFGSVYMAPTKIVLTLRITRQESSSLWSYIIFHVQITLQMTRINEVQYSVEQTTNFQLTYQGEYLLKMLFSCHLGKPSVLSDIRLSKMHCESATFSRSVQFNTFLFFSY